MEGAVFADQMPSAYQQAHLEPPFLCVSIPGVCWLCRHRCPLMLSCSLISCLVLSALPVLARCLSPYFGAVNFGGQREVGVFYYYFLLLCIHFVPKPDGFSPGVRESPKPSPAYKS